MTGLVLRSGRRSLNASRLQLLGESDEFGRAALENGGESFDHGQRGGLLAALKQADVGSMETGLASEALLGDAALGSQLPEREGEAFAKATWWRHGGHDQ
jgi:hypothetical protein